MKRVLLAVMPFLPLHRPALGVSALKAACEAAGFPCDIAYFTFDWAREIGLRDYVRLDGGLPTQNLTGEWVFSSAAFDGETESFESYRNSIIATSPPGFYDPALVERLEVIADKAKPFVAVCAAKIDLEIYDIVGLTSTFQQNCASLALARAIKRRSPSTVTILGGGNCDGPMGPAWLDLCPWLDIVVSGEADLVLPELVARLRNRESLKGLSGVALRQSRATALAPPVHDLDKLPYPDFEDYFAALDGFADRKLLTPELSFESSRGCWWGQKHHCTFCGLNGTSMRYRWKAPERAYRELRSLVDKWGVNRLFASDNIIHPRYFAELFPRLAEDGVEIDIQYEMKSNLKREQLRIMRATGTTWFQPGIESLSSKVLRLMDKGVKAIVNIQTLKWAREMGLRVTWNCLCGFPGESAEDYRQMHETMRHIVHVAPPASFAVFRLDRFSPMFEQAVAHGIEGIRPGRAYRFCFPFESEDLARIAYFFEYNQIIDDETLLAVSDAWRFCNVEWEPYQSISMLTATVSDLFVLVQDTRHGWPVQRELLVGLDRAVLLAADCVQSAPAILATVRERLDDYAITSGDVENAVARLVDAGWMLREQELYLSLPLFSGCEDDELGPVKAVASLPARKEIALL